ncbi:MAG: hypothetical protein JWM87_3752 [Candidatus Eremiobacteraeota bacterium]|nr:hypothetical protein [Candidatus Eremiobacteraeota bacterium]
MQQNAILSSLGWQAMQRGIERTLPLMSAAYKRVARDAQLLATKAPGIPEWALGMFPRFAAVEIARRLPAEAYEPSAKYAEIVPVRRRRAKIRVVRRKQTEADEGPRLPPDPPTSAYVRTASESRQHPMRQRTEHRAEIPSGAVTDALASVMGNRSPLITWEPTGWANQSERNPARRAPRALQAAGRRRLPQADARGDEPVYGLRIERMETTYRTTYSISDKISFFLDAYLEKVTFREVWTKTKGTPFASAQNWPLWGLYGLSRDLFEPDFMAVTQPDSEAVAEIRNHLEHKYLRVVRDDVATGGVRVNADPLVYVVKQHAFEKRTLRLLNLARAALIFLVLAIHAEERGKENAGISGPKTTLPRCSLPESSLTCINIRPVFPDSAGAAGSARFDIAGVMLQVIV